MPFSVSASDSQLYRELTLLDNIIVKKKLGGLVSWYEAAVWVVALKSKQIKKIMLRCAMLC